MKSRLIYLLLFYAYSLIAQKLEINTIEPPNWWTNHTFNNVQLMVYGKNLDLVNVSSLSDDLVVTNVIHTFNNNYVFVDIEINEEAVEGKHSLEFVNDFGKIKIDYPLESRNNSKDLYQGFSNDDVLYLIFPDRFANGDYSNDSLFNSFEEFEFSSLNGRHGGDIQGIIDKLDYLKDLGITAIWSTPLIENNMYMSYHGYAATDFYKIDPRHGTNELYKELVSVAHSKGIKVILDHVSNHIGINHKWIANLPTRTWLNGMPGNHLPSDHNKIVYVDLHASEKSVTSANEGWFEDYMPDLNQRDPLLAKYIIQNTIWWIEFSGIDGIREDTYPYANQKFMSEWAAEIFKHYPNFNIVGEIWKGDPAILASFQTGSYFPKEFDSHLPVVTDFAFRDVVFNYLGGKADLRQVYELLGKDFVYAEPNNLLVFFDNHDIDRGMYAANWDLHKFEVALTLTLTTRGIPKIFYGTEIGMDGGGHHGKIRAPFPGGFINDKKNSFFQSGRNAKQDSIYTFLRKLLHLRKDFKALRTGKLTHFPPKENLYIYSKKNDEDQIMIAINDDSESKTILLSDYINTDHSEYKLINLLTGETELAGHNTEFDINKKSITIYLIE